MQYDLHTFDTEKIDYLFFFVSNKGQFEMLHFKQSDVYMTNNNLYQQ